MRTRERQKLMISLLEKKIRLHAQQLYDQRGQAEGLALEDWIKAESEVLKSSILAPLWSVREGLESTEA
jgi:regulation of enolase protein 1 (concanavalin A-like superfamily)